MTTLSENDPNAECQLDGALQSYPIVSAPDDFSESVINRLRESSPRPKFRLSWIDYALTIFWSGMLSMILFLIRLVPAHWIIGVRFQAFLLWERGTRNPMMFILLMGCTLAALMTPYLISHFKRARFVITTG